MPALCFPNPSVLRLALTSGLVPPAVARASAAAGHDPAGPVWVEPAGPVPRESLAALARLGVRTHAAAAVPTAPAGSWGELLDLQPDSDPPAGPFLVVVPAPRLSAFVARLRRETRGPVGVRLPDADPACGWVSVAATTPGLVRDAADPEAGLAAYAEQAAGVWVRCGWRHPAPDLLPVPGGGVVLADPPRSVRAVAGEVPAPAADEFRLSPRRGTPTPPAPSPPPVAVRLTLGPRPVPVEESLWVLGPDAAAEFWAFCRTADERLLRRLEVATVASGADARLVLRLAGKRLPPALPLLLRGFAADPRVPGLFVPSDRVLKPAARVRELAVVLGTATDRVVWVEPAAGGLVAHGVPASAFRPLADRLVYEAPPPRVLAAAPRADPFPLPRFAAPTDPPAKPEPVVDLADEPDVPAVERPEAPGWWGQSLRKLVARLLPARATPTPEPRPDPPPAGRGGRAVASPDALLHGGDRAARRRELEDRVYRDLPRLDPAGRAGRWADLAAAYGATGNPADAAVCWLNAVWEVPTPPPAWLGQWLAAELRAGKFGDAPDPERWLGEPGRPGVGRVVAAFVAAAGAAPDPGYVAALPRLLALLDGQFDEVPVRAAWLARLAAARACDGDALGLARWRDRVLARLGDRGPGLDLDEPSFVRFHGTATADRFQAARDFLVRAREPVLGWVRKHGGGVLRWAGLDAETDGTAAYAQFLLAWGLGCLGERTRAKDWAARARKAVAAAAGPGADPKLHAALGDLFLLRVRDAVEGRPPKPGLPPDLRARFDALPELARYAAERLREQSRVLEPRGRPGAFGGPDGKTFRGSDRLGERLGVLAASPEPEDLATEADALLRLCADRPATDTVPRVVLTLLGHAPRLDQAAVLRLLDLLPAAVDWAEAWIAAGPWPDDERPAALVRYRGRMLAAGFAAAAALDPPTPAAVADLVRRLTAGGDRLRPALLAAAGPAFRAARRAGAGADALLQVVDPGRSARGADPLGVALAAGWFAAGDEEAGTRLLDEARDALYLDPAATPRTRTPLAVAYAEALGSAPTRVAHGRLEELFQRLGPVEVSGSTNRYFTLQPLRLVDAVVRAVVTDDFALGPAVRDWLDDDEFLIRSRVHRDLAAVLRGQGLG
ncbi:MAG: hypothetical protein C0501_23470 [Isosphaera sp.]|nr:hypothetical protein [Isosphaera sp.]